VNKNIRLIVILGLATLALDQGTKQWARASLRGKPGVTLLRNYLELQYHENPGMAFGLGRNLPGGRYVLTAVGIAVLVIVWRIVGQVRQRRRLAHIAFALVAGGAIGNLIDRLYIGRVVDFVVMHWRHRYSWPAYNVADAALVVGVGLLLIALSAKQDGARAAGSTPSRRKSKRDRKRR
jgi:signal peptidase II